jgi:hypothetical protein
MLCSGKTGIYEQKKQQTKQIVVTTVIHLNLQQQTCLVSDLSCKVTPNTKNTLEGYFDK